MTMDAYRNPLRRERSPRLRSTLHRAVRLAALGVGLGFGAGLAALALDVALLRPERAESPPPLDVASLPGEAQTAAQPPVTTGSPSPDPTASTPVSLGMSPDQARASIAREADAVIKALHDRDTRALAAMIDPDVGLEFGPGGELGNERRALGRKDVEGCFRDRRVRVWGTDGSAGDVTLSCAAYWEKYVVDRDFAASANIAYNEHPDYTHDVGSTFTPQTDEAFVEYYVPPDPEKSLPAAKLTLVFSPIGRAWKLTGVVHAEERPSETE